MCIASFISVHNLKDEAQHVTAGVPVSATIKILLWVVVSFCSSLGYIQLTDMQRGESVSGYRCKVLQTTFFSHVCYLEFAIQIKMFDHDVRKCWFKVYC